MRSALFWSNLFRNQLLFHQLWIVSPLCQKPVKSKMLYPWYFCFNKINKSCFHSILCHFDYYSIQNSCGKLDKFFHNYYIVLQNNIMSLLWFLAIADWLVVERDNGVELAEFSWKEIKKKKGKRMYRIAAPKVE